MMNRTVRMHARPRLMIVLLVFALLASTFLPGAESAHANTGKTVRQAFFYDKPKDGTSMDFVEQHAKMVIFGRGVSYYRDLKAAGYTGLGLEYLMANEVNGPWATPGSSCDSWYKPYQNTVAYNQGDFCKYVHKNESWFLHNGKGQRLYGKRSDGHYVYHMNPASSGWRNFAASRIYRDLVGDSTQAKKGFDGIFLDNVALKLYKLKRQIGNSDGTVKEFSSDSAYRSAVVGHLGVIRSKINGAGPLWANIIDDRGVSVTDYMPVVDKLDGFMNESWAMKYPSESGSLSADDWNNVLKIAEQTLSKGKGVFSVVQGSKDNYSRQRFALASHLLIAKGSKSYFRYTHASRYGEWWKYDNYNVTLGAPKGSRYQVGSSWRRDFECGYVIANPSDLTSKIVETC